MTQHLHPSRQLARSQMPSGNVDDRDNRFQGRRREHLDNGGTQTSLRTLTRNFERARAVVGEHHKPGTGQTVDTVGYYIPFVGARSA